jgi:hypothetical protein
MWERLEMQRENLSVNVKGNYSSGDWHTWEESIKIYLTEMGYEVVDFVHMV